MFSFLDMINHYLGYINVNVKIKNQVYTVLGILGDVYLFYVAIKYFQNGLPLWGLLILAAATILLYFAVLNIIYYFTQRRAKWDISPKIEKLLGGRPPEAEPQVEGGRAIARDIPANGFFDEKKILPGKLRTSPAERQAANELAIRLQQHQLLTLDYSGLSDEAIADQYQRLHKPVYASGPGLTIPYFDMETTSDGLVVFAGINQAEKQRMGVINTVGLQPVEDVRQEFNLYLANASLVGGPFKVMGRTSVIEQQNDFEVAVQVAYKRKPAAVAGQGTR